MRLEVLLSTPACYMAKRNGACSSNQHEASHSAFILLYTLENWSASFTAPDCYCLSVSFGQVCRTYIYDSYEAKTLDKTGLIHPATTAYLLSPHLVKTRGQKETLQSLDMQTLESNNLIYSTLTGLFPDTAVKCVDATVVTKLRLEYCQSESRISFALFTFCSIFKVLRAVVVGFAFTLGGKLDLRELSKRFKPWIPTFMAHSSAVPYSLFSPK